MHVELERRRDTEVPGAPPHRPEQVRLLVPTRRDDATVRQHELRRSEVVNREAVFAEQPPKSATERQSADAGGRDDAAGAREAVQLRLAVVLRPRNAALRPRGARDRIDVNTFHWRQVDHQPAVDRRAAGDVVAAAADGHLQAVFARQVHGVHYIRRVPAARDQGGPFVDQTVVHAPRLVVTDVERLEELSSEARRELVQGVGDGSGCH